MVPNGTFSLFTFRRDVADVLPPSVSRVCGVRNCGSPVAGPASSLQGLVWLSDSFRFLLVRFTGKLRPWILHPAFRLFTSAANSVVVHSSHRVLIPASWS